MKISKENQDVAVKWCKKFGHVFVKLHKTDFEYFDGQHNRRKFYVNATRELDEK